MEVRSYKDNIIEGIRIGLVAFIICFVFLGVLGAVINYAFLDDVNRLLNGSLTQAPKPTVSGMMLIVSMLFNLCFFNSGSVLANGENMHIGLMIFMAIPFIAFIIAGRRKNKHIHFNLDDFMRYIISSVVYSFILYSFSTIAKGSLLDIHIDFTRASNFFMTIIVSLLIQVFIGINYDTTFAKGVQMTRILLRIFLGMGLIAGIIGMVFVFTKFTGNILMIIGIIVLLLPNIAVYAMFTFMGASVEFGDQIQKMFSALQIDVSFGALPYGVRIACIAFFFITIVISIVKINRDNFVKETGLFAISFSGISLFLAYCTKVNAGSILNMLDIQFGIDYLFAFFVPFFTITLTGLLVLLARRIINEISH